MTKIKLLTNADELGKHIAKIAGDSVKLQAAIQIALASATFHAMAHGNVNPINTLFTTVGKGMRRAAIQTWLLAFAPVQLQADPDKAKEAPFVFSRELVKLHTETDKPTAEQAEAHAMTAAETSWVDFKPEVLVPTDFDVLELLAATIKKAKGLQAKGATAKHAEVLAKMEALIPAPVAGV